MLPRRASPQAILDATKHQLFVTHITSDHVLQKTVKIKAQHRRRFRLRLARALGFSSLLIGAALFLGVLGYHFVARFGWIDSVLNASMILTGMGPVGQLETNA